MTKKKKIVLIGGGHAHLEIVRRAGVLSDTGAQIILVDPGDFHYSAMTSGFVGGLYNWSDLVVPLEPLCIGSGVRFLAQRAEAIDPGARVIRLTSGEDISYDFLSVNAGSEVRLEGASGIISAKPLAQLRTLASRLDDFDQPKVSVIGGGVSGCEMAANLAARIAASGTGGRVRLFESTQSLAPTIPKSARAFLRDRLAQRLDCRLGSVVQCMSATELTTTDGKHFEHDIALLAVGLSPPKWFESVALDQDRSGLLVNAQLQTSDPRIFAVGDCASFREHCLPKVGVYGVRAAPVLLHNLRASVLDKPLQHYEPQQRYLGVMNLGWGCGLAWRGNRWWQGRSALWLKDRIDRRFIARYRQ